MGCWTTSRWRSNCWALWASLFPIGTRQDERTPHCRLQTLKPPAILLPPLLQETMSFRNWHTLIDPNEIKLWRVIFKDDYGCIHILDSNNREIVLEFGLANWVERGWVTIIMSLDLQVFMSYDIPTDYSVQKSIMLNSNAQQSFHEINILCKPW